MKKNSQVQLLKNEIKRLKKLVYLDPLTKIYNRRGFSEIGSRYFQFNIKGKQKRRKNEISKLTIIFLDIDDFKKVNDKHGHNKGDKVLRAFTRFLKKNLRKTDIIARWGGEEFVVLLVNISEDKSKQIVQKLCRKISKNKMSGLYLTVSAGLTFPCKNENLSQVINRADKLMYQAKKQGKNMVIISK